MATTKDDAVRILVDFAARKAPEASVNEQIVLYQALSQVFPTLKGREQAAEICKALSRAAAMQLDFHFNNPQEKDNGQ